MKETRPDIEVMPKEDWDKYPCRILLNFPKANTEWRDYCNKPARYVISSDGIPICEEHSQIGAQ